jgi:hypothetical protein
MPIFLSAVPVPVHVRMIAGTAFEMKQTQSRAS